MENVLITLPGTIFTTLAGLGGGSRLGGPRWLRIALALLRAVGPYAVIELVLPGGTLLVLLCLLVRRRWPGARDLRLGPQARSPA